MLTHMHSRKVKGFTLIEIMIVVAIIGVIAAIALPSYKDSIRKSKRQTAIGDLMLYKQAQERYRSNNLTYASSTSALDSLGVKVSSSTSDYSFSVVTGSATGTAYTLRADALGTQKLGGEATQGCTYLQITEADVRTPAQCWAK